jgi:hypothetical protein
MTNQQLYLAIGIPMLFNAGLIGILLAYINAKFSGVDQRFIGVDQRFVSIDQRFAALEQTLDRRFAAVPPLCGGGQTLRRSPRLVARGVASGLGSA